MNYLFILFILFLTVGFCCCSAGDQSPYYQKCIAYCRAVNCTEDGSYYATDYNSPLHVRLLQWSCLDDCKYDCMWKVVDAFHDRNWSTPQFHGKWPFIRLFGIQEPASTVFSLLNFYCNWKMLKEFRRLVPNKSPLYWLWHAYCLVSLNAWCWSTIFHTRDFPLTELLDYVCAFSLVLMNCYCMAIRLLRNKVPNFVLVAITMVFVAFFANHVGYLSMAHIDYTYNMLINLYVGTITAIAWFGWCTYNRFRQPYVWKCAVFVALTGMAMLLEVMDKPPLWYIFDNHSLWHLATAPLILLFYSFAIDDCNYLRKQERKKKND